ncbi:carbamoyl-phosphate synthase large subunit [Aquifex aeolicus]|uniref:Carbamoyl phosphate synthase large chain, C-terminal section n=1 Tax=Aquifex aeolicus (strain VF5) TaxID=224324 RepID=CARB2_AQUAE|nr:carbamoyl-phosphate synthase large subunit [Aquifex aeolicus]O67233.1 RecName: Full=Carbamoyl phosphate synthase large chain, C-terminal section; AltName: Full=Carbamoyl phosphate synthetase ammonia chain [Aquifex aeolicus VF5]AAC07203.1 carbamoyl-phosphate synthase large subunit [Aquifex aeolicus VF5]
MSKKVVILGSGPNRIGQGIEFDYACVHAVFSLQEEGYYAVMVNCNPETVSTDYDTADKLYFEPIVFEHVMDIIEREKPEGVILQFGGQTPLKLALPLQKNGVKILGTKPESIDKAEDRELFRELIIELGLKQPPSGTARTKEEALKIAKEIGFPVLVRPSYVLGGRAMRIVYDEEELKEYLEEAVSVSHERPVLIDKFLDNSIELDVDAVSDGKDVLIGAVMEHIEEAGVHSGDSATSIPPYSLSKEIVEEVKEQTRKLAVALEVKGLINVQYAVQNNEVYVLEVNPRASRTVPFVSKSIGYPLAKIATKVAIGKSLREILPEVFERLEKGEAHFASDFLPKEKKIFSVKEVVFPWKRFPEVDPILGPEMKSTGEVMGIDKEFGLAYYKAQLSAGYRLPEKGNLFISVADRDKPKILELAKEFEKLGFGIYATSGTYKFLKEHGVNAKRVLKVSEGRPNVVDMIINGEIHLVINTPSGKREKSDAYYIRRACVQFNVPYYTTMRAGYAVLEAIKSIKKLKEEGKGLSVHSLQEIYNI